MENALFEIIKRLENKILHNIVIEANCQDEMRLRKIINNNSAYQKGTMWLLLLRPEYLIHYKNAIRVHMLQN